MDCKKIGATPSNMGEGEATGWAKPLLQKYINKEHHTYFISWAEFKKAFLWSFADSLRKDKAIREINKLSQTGPAMIYPSHFKTIKEDLDWDEQALTDHFKVRLMTEVQQELIKMQLSMNIENLSLEELIELAIKVDNVFFQARKVGPNPSNTRTNQMSNQSLGAGPSKNQTQKQERKD
ncbi:hypothetical protein FRC11_004259 [Ceratobasidium sp. 423]|nr:hypothetical protein FRC11_004259 [Ceratobasidium sp. 423]